MRIHASTNTELEELLLLARATSAFLGAVEDALTEPTARRPSLTVVQGSKRKTAKSTRRKRPALRIVTAE